jgi:DsbC/DsbD-like thiol-disulfide interchange protein
MQNALWGRAGALALVIICAAQPAEGQAPAPVSWSVRADDVPALAAGTAVRVTLIASLAPGWHIYSLTQKPGGPFALSIYVPAEQPFVLDGDVSGPKPEVQNDASLGVPIELYSGVAEFTIPLKLRANSSGRELEGRVAARFQVCSDTICLPPRTITLPVRLQQRAKGPAR